MIEIKGVVEKIIYRNEDNGYTVARFSTEEESITINGSCAEIKTSMEYELKGDFIFHKKYGEQFKFESIEEILPQSENGIINYLSSGIIPFIGEKTAKNIVDKFKTETLKILEEDTERLLEVDGIGPRKLDKIKSALLENRGLRRLTLFLNKHELGTTLAVKIYKEYGERAIQIIKENPYKLAEDISGVGFKKADKIAMSIGEFRGSSFRNRAALKYILSLATLEGHSFLPKDILIKRTHKLVGDNIEQLENELLNLSLDDRFFIEQSDGEICCYYAPYLRAENYISGKIKELVSGKFEYDTNIDEILKKIEERNEIKFATNQVIAVREAVEKGVLIITGGPGTGKTTTLKAIIEIFESMGKSVKLAAPTGRAAKRMKEATNRDASTIHRLLEIRVPDDDRINYGYEEEVELDCDVLIVDEVSMVDLGLMNTLLHSIKKGTRLILVGDKDQLPSVGAGNVLSDLIESKRVSVVNLNEIFRQKEQSSIIKNAHLINNGILPEISNSGDFYMISEQNEKKSLEVIKELVSRRLPQYYGVNSNKIQVLAPMKKGNVGIYSLNKTLQEVLNPKGDEIIFGDNVFRVGDKVMQTKNNYNLEYKIESEFYLEEGEGVFNGDIGYVVEIDIENKSLVVLYDDVKKVKYEYSDLDELILSYACTIHKSQGSEFDIVIIPLHFAPYILLTRNLIYTAITRAKKLVVLVGEYKYLDIMVKNNRISKRYSNLCKKLMKDD
ncbi:ATP-dependent RecD-like DNA helicase [Peptoniphilus sp. oral taxon 386]|uniref:SF1B family DNA helicase RecD2 n=1 Tax=Peptoniphilus sp. oral taxon 386 TaxID=652713 RepID=UPI0001DA99DD|nr:ATP-dependent RecD-like DNA helicase [Peptoniphilus sp. oral taxon 386]EFI41783.1 helicase, RecD/TraA family [Peptoniphilus sp. oral taxon 386 str. F0131]